MPKASIAQVHYLLLEKEEVGVCVYAGASLGSYAIVAALPTLVGRGLPGQLHDIVAVPPLRAAPLGLRLGLHLRFLSLILSGVHPRVHLIVLGPNCNL